MTSPDLHQGGNAVYPDFLQSWTFLESSWELQEPSYKIQAWYIKQSAIQKVLEV